MTESVPQVTVVVPCYNAAPFLEETLSSVGAQTLDGVELIVVDDGSIDSSREVARAWMQARREIPSTLLEIPHSGHPAVPRNTGIAAAAAELILCLDADDELTPEFLELCVAALKLHPSASIAYTDQQDFGDGARHHVVPEYDLRTLVNRNFFGICSVFRKQAWRDVGGFDPKARYEDWNFWLACAACGHLGIKVHNVAWRYRVREAGRFLSDDVLNDRRAKADFVRRRPGLYSATQQAWAQAVLTGDPIADQIPNTIGAIPEFPSEPTPGPIRPVVTAPPARDTSAAGIGRPVVTVVIPTYNLAHYLPAAIDSALAQRDVPGAIEVVVVDDGSQDATPEVLAGYGERIRAVRQANGGLSRAIDRGLGLATGEFIALLDADDTWPEDRLARHIAALTANPRVGLVHGDMVITDADGRVLQDSFFAQPHMAPSEGRVLGKLVADNFVSGGACTFRSSLLPALYPIPEDVAYPDWWIAACIAAVAEIRSVEGNANNYRQHGANMGLGVNDAEKPRLLRAELPWRRKLLREFSGDATVTAAELAHARSTLVNAIQVAAGEDPLGARGVLAPDREASAVTLASLPRATIGAARSKALMKALAEDPFDGAVSLDLDRTLQLEHRFGPLPPPAPLIDLLAAAPLTIAWLDEIVAAPELLADFAAGADGVPDTTLAVLVDPLADIAGLIEAAESDSPIAAIPIQVVSEPTTLPARALLESMTLFRLTLEQPGSQYTVVPQHPAALRRSVDPAAGGR